MENVIEVVFCLQDGVGVSKTIFAFQPTRRSSEAVHHKYRLVGAKHPLPRDYKVYHVGPRFVFGLPPSQQYPKVESGIAVDLLLIQKDF